MTEWNSISVREFEDRHEKVRTFLRERDLGALFAYSPPIEHKWAQTGHVSYLSGWANHDRIIESAVVIPADGPAALLFAGMPHMFPHIAEVSPIEDARLVKAVDPNAVAIAEAGKGAGPRDFASETLAILDENGLAEKDVEVVGLSSMPAPFYEGLRGVLGDQCSTVGDVVADLRAVKSPAEVDAMKEVARLSDLGFEAMIEVPGPA